LLDVVPAAAGAAGAAVVVQGNESVSLHLCQSVVVVVAAVVAHLVCRCKRQCSMSIRQPHLAMPAIQLRHQQKQ
jgi:hypothetical protein